ncbi:MAG: YicC/YloC family endoribonuclease [Cyclobacteriaceae bacterium]
MLRSMTGYGSANRSEGGKRYSVEIKSLNSKFLDLTLRIPRACSEFEGEFRGLITEKLERGKVSLTIETATDDANSSQYAINKPLFSTYFAEFKALADATGVSADAEIFKMAMNAPDVQQTVAKESLDPEEKESLIKLILEACEKCDHFRKSEGAVLENKLKGYVDGIYSGLDAIARLDPQRIDKIRTKLKSSISEWFGQADYDHNRLEQEMIFYIERLDIQEELVRLRTHLDYFLSNMNASKASGRKLAFISQEIGREINTIGSKASDAAIQTHVVVMKEELEKIKEQLNNIL